MEHTFTCPSCGEEISMVLDLSVCRHTYIEDCEVCCAPRRDQLYRTRRRPRQLRRQNHRIDSLRTQHFSDEIVGLTDNQANTAVSHSHQPTTTAAPAGYPDLAVATGRRRGLITRRSRYGGRGPNQNRSWLIGLLIRAWQFRNGCIHDSDNVSLIIQADGDALSD